MLSQTSRAYRSATAWTNSPAPNSHPQRRPTSERCGKALARQLPTSKSRESTWTPLFAWRAYRRLHPGIWAWTLTTKGDCVYHYKHARALSVREFARLQSFPDRFTFTTDPRVGQIEGRHSEGAAHSRYRQVGNAVPPLLAKAAAQAIRASLRKALSSEGLKTLAA